MTRDPMTKYAMLTASVIIVIYTLFVLAFVGAL